MMLLVLVALIAFVGTFLAVPLFEFVIGILLLVPTVRFFLAFALLKIGHPVPNGPESFILYVFSFVLLVGAAYKAWGRRNGKIDIKEFYPIVFFGSVFTIAYQLCMLWPDFVDLGERLRDYAILASSIQSPVLPQEPWMEGIKLNYYVYWYRFGNLLSSVLGLEVWQIYHVMLSLSMSLYAAVIFQIVRVIMGGSIGLSCAAGVLIPFGSNVAGIFSVKRVDKGFGWEDDNGWWGPSRVIQGAIDEFPAWSFVLGDAHPHFLNLAAFPFFVLILYHLISATGTFQVRLLNSGLFVIAATLFLMASNAWEVPMWLGTVAALAIVGWYLLSDQQSAFVIPSLKGKPVFAILKACIGIIVLLASLVGIVLFFDKSDPLPSLVLLAIGVGFFYMSVPLKRPPAELFSKLLSKRPSLLSVSFWFVLFVALKISSRHIVPEGVSIDMVRSPILVTTTDELLMHWGVQIFFLTIGSILLLQRGFSSVVVAGFIGISLLFDKAALFLFCLLAVQVIRLINDRQQGQHLGWRAVFEYGIIISGLALIITPEIVFVNDSYGADIERMNTIFKLYTTAWGLLGLSAVSVMHRCFQEYSATLEAPGPALPAMVGGTLVVILGLACSAFYLHTAPMRWGGMESKGASRSEGLGTADKWHRGAADTIRALRVRPRGRVLEAQGRAYSYSSFVSTLAAQPSYLGWPNHINLLTKENAEVSRRQKITDQIYNQSDCAARKDLAKEEQIRYIVVGTLERKNYNGIESRDFSCFSSVVKSGDYELFEIPLS